MVKLENNFSPLLSLPPPRKVGMSSMTEHFQFPQSHLHPQYKAGTLQILESGAMNTT